VNEAVMRRLQWVHPEAQPLIERSVSSCIWLAYNFRSNRICQSDIRAHWALSEWLRFWMHPLDDLEEYTNSSERSRIRSATVESAERDHYLRRTFDCAYDADSGAVLHHKYADRMFYQIVIKTSIFT